MVIELTRTRATTMQSMGTVADATAHVSSMFHHFQSSSGSSSSSLECLDWARDQGAGNAPLIPLHLTPRHHQPPVCAGPEFDAPLLTTLCGLNAELHNVTE